DASRFRDLLQAAGRARADDDRAGARDAYRRALGLWRGPVLADVPALHHHPAVTDLSVRRIQATIAYADLVDRTDRDDALLRLHTLARDEPLHEGLAASLMLALAAGGDQAA